MVHPADDFRSHVAGSSTRFVGVVIPELPSHPKICDVNVAVFLKHNVFGFEVTMDDIVGMNILEGLNNAGNNEPFIEVRLLV